MTDAGGSSMQLTDRFALERDEAAPGVVMVIESIYPTWGGGGAEHQVTRLAHYFLRRGMAVRVLVPRWFGRAELEREVVDGIPVERLTYPRLRFVGGVLMLWRLAVWLYRERHSYAAIHAHIAGNMAAVCCIVGRALGKPVTVKYTGFTDVDARAGRRLWSSRLQLTALRRATWIQATSRRIAAGLASSGFAEAQVRLIPNAVDIERFRPCPELRAAERARHNVPADAVVVIYCGRLDPVKGIDVLLEAWERAFAARSGYFLLIIGRAIIEEVDAELRAGAARLRCFPQLRFLGGQKHVNEVMAAADFAVLPSRHEGLSNALLEFMAAGLPVVGTRVSGTEDLIEPGVNGTLCEPGDAADLETALLEMALLPAAARAALGKKARERVIEHADIARIAPQVAALYGLPHVSRTVAVGSADDGSCVA